MIFFLQQGTSPAGFSLQIPIHLLQVVVSIGVPCSDFTMLFASSGVDATQWPDWNLGGWLSPKLLVEVHGMLRSMCVQRGGDPKGTYIVLWFCFYKLFLLYFLEPSEERVEGGKG